MMATYSIRMKATKCREKGTQKKPWKMRFVTRKVMAGVSRLAVVMPGVGFSAPTMTKIVDVGNSVLQVYGVRRLIHQIMGDRFDGLSITVLPVRTGKSRFEL